MKKTITKPDGTHEVVEGTPEEIADYERKLRAEPIREEPKKPGLLTDDVKRTGGQSLLERSGLFAPTDWSKIIEEYLKDHPIKPYQPAITWQKQHSFECPVAVAQRGAWLCVNPPECNCGAANMTYKTSISTELWVNCDKCHMMRKYGEACSCERIIDWSRYMTVTNGQYYNGNMSGWKL